MVSIWAESSKQKLFMTLLTVHTVHIQIVMNAMSNLKLKLSRSFSSSYWKLTSKAPTYTLLLLYKVLETERKNILIMTGLEPATLRC